MSERLAALALLLVLAVVACTGGDTAVQPPAPLASRALARAEASLPDDDVVGLTLYFRAGHGEQAHLVPVVREVPVVDDLPRRALELLLAGPTRLDGPGLSPPLPTTTQVLRFAVAGEVATVDLSSAVVDDAGTVGRDAHNEVLAMAALANTLTEFPTIERVRVAIAGAPAPAPFWGAWGLPLELVRDESTIGEPAPGEGVPELEQFSQAVQHVGDLDAPPARVANVRARPRSTYLRIVIELADDGDPDEPRAVPAARARRDGDAVVVDVDGIAELAPDASALGVVQLADAAFERVEIAAPRLPGRLTVTVSAGEPRAFWLHTLSNPTRVVLDVRK